MHPPSELELVRKELTARLRIWGFAAVAIILALVGVALYLTAELHKLANSVVRLNEPLMIYNPAWDTVIDAVDPSRFPGTHRDDVRKGTLVQQWPAHGGPQHLWQLRRPYGERYQTQSAPVPLPIPGP